MALKGCWPIVALLVLLLALRVCQAITEPDEVSALLAMKEGWGNPASLVGWNSSSDPCEQTWRGILCSPTSQSGNRRITGIQLPGNFFNGTLSSAVGALTSLTLLDLNGNLLTGAMPPEVGNLRSLQRFVIHGNNFSGPLDPWLPKLANLRIADFGMNRFSGPFPDSIGNALNTLQNLDCTLCSLSGPIPASVGLLSSLQMLGLGGNNLTGIIPPEIGSIGGLQFLNLQNNSLSGPVPSELAALTNLQMLLLAFNDLTGPVPTSILSNPAVLARFDGNPLCSLPANAPVCTGPSLPPLGMPPGGPGPGFGGPGFGGPGQPGGGPPVGPGGGAPVVTAAAPAVSPAAAPTPLAAAPSPVPSTGASTGSAAVPSSSSWGANQSEPASAAAATSTTLSNSFNPPLTTDSGSSFPLGATIGIILGAASLVAMCIFFALLVVFRRRQDKELADSLKGAALLGSAGTASGSAGSGTAPPATPTSGSDTWSDKLFSLTIAPGSQSGSSPQTSGDHGKPEPANLVAPLLFTFKALQKMTDGFDPARQVGEGGFGKVYWARSKDRDVAVKRLDKDAATSAKYGEKQFRTEVDVLSRIRHPHLLALIGYCADGGERALVYPLMQNHSLFDQLHRAPKPCPALATWRKRLTIATQAASALAYLHNEASPPVIHRDFTSSNVLLDGGWTAVVSDFGLAKLMSKAGTPSMVQSTRLHGTLGYLAPEYLRGHVTVKNDVYSFGVVLLELLSGRRAAASEEFDLVQWAADVIDGPPPALPKLLDPAVKDEAPEELLTAAVRVARACVETDPKRRPRMNEVYTSLTVALEAAYGENSGLIVSKPLAISRPAAEAHAVVNIPEAESI
ncbi:Protein kinase superfamily protein [Klebsormidium nitens]|uniref:Protein kinase superfamily protein n=1 Tax=Klebsormidium nitens TaxID=105231 RepID=A0A1Y1HKW7_KLENI|nr:Protein kinase superfamily protein [Klebsormidium nitens]|eukprot:GAQ79254.1 Protein kinase superfamily protein [Klebsormidium nitens]